MYQLAPDYTKILTAERAESYFIRFKFKGPGLYKYVGTTILAVPMEAVPDLWLSPWDSETVFRFNVYQCCEWHETLLFAVSAKIPVRYLEPEVKAVPYNVGTKKVVSKKVASKQVASKKQKSL